MSDGEQWLANHAVTELWSNPNEDAIAFTLVPQWSIFKQLAPQEGSRILVHYFGNSTSQEGDVWVDAEDLGPIDEPQEIVEPEWATAADEQEEEPEPEALRAVETYDPPTAQPIPRDHLPHIVAAARVAEIDPALLAATAARESSFEEHAFRAERHLAFVRWRSAPQGRTERQFDGSIGVCQILRSNFLAFGIDNDSDAYHLGNNYRIAALIIRQNLAAFPGDLWKAVAAYNVGQHGARIGRVPAGGYTETILRSAEEYRPIFRKGLRSAGAGGGQSRQAGGGDAEPGRPGDVIEPMIEHGFELLGTPYVFGGKYVHRDKGLDCSGFVCEVLEHCGVSIGNRDYLSAEAIRQKTEPIDEGEAQAGDLVFFHSTYDTPGASHIGVWIGPGKMLDTHQPTGVQVTDLTTPYWREHFLSMGRLPELERHMQVAHGGRMTRPRMEGEPEPSAESAPGPELASSADRCSFCGKARERVRRLIAGPPGSGVAICNQCVTLYCRIVGQPEERQQSS